MTEIIEAVDIDSQLWVGSDGNTKNSSGRDFWKILQLTIMQIFKQSYDNLMSSLSIVNIKNAFTVNLKTSLFTSSCKNIGKYVMLCN